MHLVSASMLKHGDNNQLQQSLPPQGSLCSMTSTLFAEANDTQINL